MTRNRDDSGAVGHDNMFSLTSRRFPRGPYRIKVIDANKFRRYSTPNLDLPYHLVIRQSPDNLQIFVNGMGNIPQGFLLGISLGMAAGQSRHGDRVSLFGRFQHNGVSHGFHLDGASIDGAGMLLFVSASRQGPKGVSPNSSTGSSEFFFRYVNKKPRHRAALARFRFAMPQNVDNCCFPSKKSSKKPTRFSDSG